MLVLVLISSPALGKGAESISRGGLGFLFSDHNSFQNPSRFASASVFAWDAKYDTSNRGTVKGVTTSAVFGTGAVGVGAYGSRNGTNLSTSGSYDDTAGAGMGLNLAKGKASIGVGYRREVTPGQVDDGRVDAVVTVGGDKGLSFGVGGSSELNAEAREKQTATVGLGYRFANGFTLETNGVVNDMANIKNFSAGAFLARAGQNAYMALGYQWHNSSSLHGASGRVGLVLAKTFDVSVYATHVFQTGADPSYGGSLRFAF
jgi:hypothetical protein